MPARKSLETNAGRVGTASASETQRRSSTASTVSRATTNTQDLTRISLEDNLKRTLENHEVALQEKQKQLEAALSAKDGLQQDLNAAARDINRLKSDRNYKDDDDHLIAIWRDLQYEIKNWAFTHFDGDAKRNAFPKPPKLITGLVANYKAYLGSPQLRPLLIQAFVWNTLSPTVISSTKTSSSLIWAGKQHENFNSLCKFLEPGVSHLVSRIAVIEGHY